MAASPVPEPDPKDIAAALGWLVGERRAHGGKPKPPWSLDRLRGWARACRSTAPAT